MTLLLLVAVEVFLSFFTEEDEERPWWEGHDEGTEWFEDIRFYLALVIVGVGVALAYFICNTGDARSLAEAERWYHCYWCAERGCCKDCDFDDSDGGDGDDYGRYGTAAKGAAGKLLGGSGNAKRRCAGCCC